MAKYVATALPSFFKEVIYLNRLTSLSGCAIDSKSVVDGAIEVVNDMMAGDEIAAFESALKVAHEMADTIKTCKGVPEDVSALERWFATKFSSKQALVDAASANAHAHSQEIEQQVQGVWDSGFPYTFEKPHEFGKAVAQVSFWALGPVDSSI